MTDSPRLRAVFLGSGSAGNATAIEYGDTLVLVDCGFSAREVSRRMAAAGLDAARVSAILVTHEHGDHVRGIDVFVRRHAPGCEIVASEGTARAARLDGLEAHVRRVRGLESLRIGRLAVVPFATSHDAAEPLGFRFSAGGRTLGLMTDSGVLTEQAAEALSGVNLLGIESNHDDHMLETGPYPHHLKRRIRSRHGHLSNADAARAVERLAHDGLEAVIGLHRSRTNNTAALAGAALESCVDRLGLKVPVSVAAQDTSCDTDPPQGTLFGTNES
jgi:phosphoribosyl 1,2-cyclic phosphodiesterase